MNLKFIIVGAASVSMATAAPIKIEAESAIPADEHNAVAVTDAKASGGSYVAMKEGNLEFKVSVEEAGYYTLWANYQLSTKDGNKIQDLAINGVTAGQISFGTTEEFKTIKAAGKIKLTKGENTIGIIKSWGWINLDYIEITEYEPTPFSLSTKPVTPEPTESAQKLYNFLLSNFGKKTISGVMTNRVMENDGKYTPQTYENQEELKYIFDASGKNVALVGFDFMHGSGLNSEEEWYQGYTHAALEMAKLVWEKGGIPAFNWHWKDPMHDVEAFYTESSQNTPFTTFSIGKAYDLNSKKWKNESDEYKAIERDLNMIADSLLVLQKAGVALLWRPLHEASGKWFWWGTDGAEACVALYKLMFDTFVNKKGLHNLIWVWTTDEAGDALDWYPGDEYVDVVGRDYYYYPREANHASLVGSFEIVKDIFGGKKIVALSENGSVPYPNEMKTDGANWSWFMPWYGDYAMESWANDNTKESWKTVMDNDYVITLENMPGWDKYVMDTTIKENPEKPTAIPQKLNFKSSIEISVQNRTLSIYTIQPDNRSIDIFDMNGKHITRLYRGFLKKGISIFNLAELSHGQYIIRVKGSRQAATQTIRIK